MLSGIETLIWGISANMETRKLTKPVYKRQQFLLAFLKELNEPLTATDFQKLLFLYLNKNNLFYYDFIPYIYGGFSLQAREDISTLQNLGWVVNNNGKIQYTGEDGVAGIKLPNVELGMPISEQLPKVRGNRLVKLVYEQYPYYAIYSRIVHSIMNIEGLSQINAVKEEIKNTKQMLFTIGYEGINIEQFLNLLIKNNVQLLCDVRNNPLSRKFGFSKGNLSKFLNNIGIEYVHIPELGITSDKRQNMNIDEDYQKLFNEYNASLHNRKEAIDQVYQFLQKKNRIALACFEHEPSRCHRHILRDYLKKIYNVNVADL